MRVVVHEPGAVVVHVHGPRLVVLPQHHVLQDIGPGDAEGRVRVVVVAIHRHLPVVDASGEGGVSEDHPVVVAVARHRQVVVGEDDVRVGGGGVKGEPSDCTHAHTHRVSLTLCWPLVTSHTARPDDDDDDLQVRWLKRPEVI